MKCRFVLPALLAAGLFSFANSASAFDLLDRVMLGGYGYSSKGCDACQKGDCGAHQKGGCGDACQKGDCGAAQKGDA